MFLRLRTRRAIVAKATMMIKTDTPAPIKATWLLLSSFDCGPLKSAVSRLLHFSVINTFTAVTKAEKYKESNFQGDRGKVFTRC